MGHQAAGCAGAEGASPRSAARVAMQKVVRRKEVVNQATGERIVVQETCMERVVSKTVVNQATGEVIVVKQTEAVPMSKLLSPKMQKASPERPSAAAKRRKAKVPSPVDTSRGGNSSDGERNSSRRVRVVVKRKAKSTSPARPPNGTAVGHSFRRKGSKRGFLKGEHDNLEEKKEKEEEEAEKETKLEEIGQVKSRKKIKRKQAKERKAAALKRRIVVVSKDDKARLLHQLKKQEEKLDNDDGTDSNFEESATRSTQGRDEKKPADTDDEEDNDISIPDLRLSGAILFPILASYLFRVLLPFGGGLMGSGLFMVFLPLFSIKLGCEGLLGGNRKNSREYERNIQISQLLLAASFAMYGSTLITSDTKVNLAFGGFALGSYLFAGRAMAILRRENFAEEAGADGHSINSLGVSFASKNGPAMGFDITKISWTKIRNLVPFHYRVLFSLLMPIPLAAFLAKYAPLPLGTFALFSMALPHVTMRVGRLALFNRSALKKAYSFFEVVGVAATFLNPVVYMLTLVSTQVELLANLASMGVGLLSWLCVIAGFFYRKSPDSQSAPGASAAGLAGSKKSWVVASAVRAWGFGLLFGVVPIVVPVAAFLTFMHSHSISNPSSENASIGDFLSSRKGMRAVGLYLLCIPPGTLGLGALLRGPSDSVYSLVFPWTKASTDQEGGQYTSIFGVVGWLSYALAVYLYARNERADSPGLVLSAGFLAWGLMVSSLFLHSSSTRASQVKSMMFNSELAKMILEPNALSVKLGRFISILVLLAGLMLFVLAVVVEFYATSFLVRVTGIPLVNCLATGVLYLTHSYVSEVAQSSRHGVRVLFGWGLFIVAMWFGWTTGLCSVPGLYKILSPSQFHSLVEPVCSWLEINHSIAITGLLGWVSQIMVGKPLIEIALGIRRKRVVQQPPAARMHRRQRSREVQEWLLQNSAPATKSFAPPPQKQGFAQAVKDLMRSAYQEVINGFVVLEKDSAHDLWSYSQTGNANSKDESLWSSAPELETKAGESAPNQAPPINAETPLLSSDAAATGAFGQPESALAGAQTVQAGDDGAQETGQLDQKALSDSARPREESQEIQSAPWKTEKWSSGSVIFTPDAEDQVACRIRNDASDENESINPTVQEGHDVPTTEEIGDAQVPLVEQEEKENEANLAASETKEEDEEDEKEKDDDVVVLQETDACDDIDAENTDEENNKGTMKGHPSLSKRASSGQSHAESGLRLVSLVWILLRTTAKLFKAIYTVYKESRSEVENRDHLDDDDEDDDASTTSHPSLTSVGPSLEDFENLQDDPVQAKENDKHHRRSLSTLSSTSDDVATFRFGGPSKQLSSPRRQSPSEESHSTSSNQRSIPPAVNGSIGTWSARKVAAPSPPSGHHRRNPSQLSTLSEDVATINFG